MKPVAVIAGCLVLLLPAAVQAETAMTPCRGQAVVLKPPHPLTDQERLDRQPTAHCFSYQHVEMRGGSPVCVENPR